MNDILLDMLACPSCKGNLLYNKEKKELVCITDRIAYPLKNDIPVMMVNQARQLSSDEYNQTTYSN